MIRCNNCMTVWKHEDDIPLLIEKDGKGVKLYNPFKDTMEDGDEVFRGCPR